MELGGSNVITKLQKSIYSKRLSGLKELIPSLEDAVKSASALGDHSENAELDSAKESLNQTYLEISTLESLMKEEVIPYDESSKINVGSIVKITSKVFQEPNNPEGSVIKLVSDSGDFLIEPVLNTSSNLGRAVLGNLSGVYKVGDNEFKVEKIINPNLDEFTSSYLDEEDAIRKLIESV